ncbi:DUF2178 domain-containing protein [Patescibacteria group bacterium]|nr:DUF2178 domain-containing protein [Patescibacteria group bacterium]MBU1890609.1 DUF2178 domain-containing protein [Patescibacteria group bacterium]
MTIKTFKKVYLGIAIFILASVVIAVLVDNLILALAGLFIGILLVILFSIKVKTTVSDERTEAISGRSAYITFHIITLLLGLLSFFFIINGYIQKDFQSESLGVTLCYITLLSITIYAITYRYFNKIHSNND